jgi:Ca2+-binding RTX toxin-like protein
VPILVQAGQSVSNSDVLTGARAVRITGAGATFTNDATGQIVTDDITAPAIQIEVGGSTVVNRAGGVIRSTSTQPVIDMPHVIAGSAGADRVENAGTIDGVVDLGNGNDVFVSRMTSNVGTPTILLGNGDDRFEIRGTYTNNGSGAVDLAAIVDGGDGVDRIVTIENDGNFSGGAIANAEILELGVNGGVESFRDLDRIEVNLGDAAHSWNVLRFFDTPDADVVLLNATTERTISLSILDRSSVGSITGSDLADRLSLGSDTVVARAIDLGAGDDYLTFSRSQFEATGQETFGTTISGGTGFDRLEIQIGGGDRIDLSNVANFEQLDIFGPTPGPVTIAGATGMSEVSISEFGWVDLEEANLASATISIAAWATLTIGSGSQVGQILAPRAFYTGDERDSSQSVSITNQGTINGAVLLGVGDDMFDGRMGTIAAGISGNVGNDVIRTDVGNDLLDGGVGDDTLSSGNGNDTLIGGAGSDMLTGGGGGDIFKGIAAELSGDTITDFGIGDRITITDASIAGFTFALNGRTLSYTGGQITLGADLPAGQVLSASANSTGGVDLTLVSSSGQIDAIRTFATGSITDAVFSADGTTIYAAVGNVLNAYSIASGAVVRSWTLGTNIGGLTVTPDGHYLIATDLTAPVVSSSRLLTVNQIDLTTGIATTLTTTRPVDASPFFDALAVANDKVFLAQFSTGSPLITLAPSSQTFMTSPGALSPGTLIASQAHDAFLWATHGSSPGALYRLDANGSFIGSASSSGFSGGVAAISLTADRIVWADGGLRAFDAGFNSLGNPGTALLAQIGGGRFTGLAFNASGTSLYALDAPLHAVYELNPADWSIRNVFAVDADGAGVGDYFAAGFATDLGDGLQLSADGNYLSVAINNKLQIVDTHVATGILGDGGNNILAGGARDDVLYGYAGNDTINGGAGADTMVGGTGDDIYHVDNAGDIVSDSGGNDSVITSIDYSADASIETVRLADGSTATLTAGGTSTTLYGNALANSLIGQSGNDTLYGLDGNDTLRGADGNDALYGGAGDDTLMGQFGANVLDGGDGTDTAIYIFGERSSYTITALGNGDLRVTGIGSDDTLHAVEKIQFSDVTILASDLVTAPAIRNDFNGDRRSDVLWRLADGTVGNYLSNGTSLIDNSAFARQVSADWRIAGTGDFNSDGRADILWRNANGTITFWSGNGTGLSDNPAVNRQVSLDWQIAGTGDFNGDGKTDILWRNANGTVTDWLSTGSNFADNGALNRQVSLDWHIAGTGDFNGDGKSDVLWRNDNGTVTVWTGNGTGGLNDAPTFAEQAGLDLHIEGTGDFNGDGKTDVLWRSDSGTLGVWKATISFFLPNIVSTPVGFTRHVAGIGDYDGDGRADVLLQDDGHALTKLVWSDLSSTFIDDFAIIRVTQPGWTSLPNSKIAETIPFAAADFNGDGKDDLLWRNENGTVTDWLSNGAGFSRNNAGFFRGVPADWRIVGTGDFNGDGKADLLWRNADGTVTDWFSNGTGFSDNGSLHRGVPVDWHVEATGDFNGDGKDDILWRNANGTVTDWFSNGTGFSDNGSLNRVVPADWTIQATGDFNGDGRDDLLWRNADGTVTDWLSNGTNFSDNGAVFFRPVSADWSIAGTGDFNGDGRTDVLWRNADGSITDWLSNGAGFSDNATFFRGVPLDWQIMGVGDYNGDGRDDIAWRASNGIVTDWLSNGSGFTDNPAATVAQTLDWSIQHESTTFLI